MTRMMLSDTAAETLVANGITDVFGILGAAFRDALYSTDAQRALPLENMDQPSNH